MHYAAQDGHKEVAEWLFSAGASVSDKDEVGMLPCVSELLDVLAHTPTCMHAVLVEEVTFCQFIIIHS